MHTSFWTWLWKALVNEQGQIPASDVPDPGTAEPTGDPAEPAPPAEGPGAPSEPQDAFIDPAQLPPELQGHFKRMQAAYTKKMQQLARVRDAAEIVDRFNTDPDFARQTIQQRAAQLGLNLGQPSGQPTNQASTMPPQLVEAVKANLSPELQWMAPALAASQWAGMQMALKPIEEQQAQTVRSTRDQQFDELAGQLSEKAPGWEQHEEDMDSLLGFLQSPKMTDRRWGSKLELLYKLVVGDGQATAEAARRMAQAAKSRNPAGQPTAAPALNIAELVKKPKNNQEAWDAAAKHALSEMQRQGIKVS